MTRIVYLVQDRHDEKSPTARPLEVSPSDLHGSPGRLTHTGPGGQPVPCRLLEIHRIDDDRNIKVVEECTEDRKNGNTSVWDITGGEDLLVSRHDERHGVDPTGTWRITVDVDGDVTHTVEDRKEPNGTIFHSDSVDHLKRDNPTGISPYDHFWTRTVGGTQTEVQHETHRDGVKHTHHEWTDSKGHHVQDEHVPDPKPHPYDGTAHTDPGTDPGHGFSIGHLDGDDPEEVDEAYA